jgi:S-adenosylmethionine:tRNA ribosyltransferase-isomerase
VDGFEKWRDRVAQRMRVVHWRTLADVDVREFDFDLPSELIAQEPAAERGAARLLHLERPTGALTHTTIDSLPQVLREGDVIVVNNTRVFPARLLGRRVPSGGAVECLLIGRAGAERTAECDGAGGEGQDRQASQDWQALMHPGQKLRPGARVVFEGLRTLDVLHGEVLERRFHGRRVIRLSCADGGPIEDAIEALGHVPLPPYIKREDRPEDRERYQTVFARERGSVAAPTAGLHFNPALNAALAARRIDIVEITLHIGYGTFQPVRVERVEDHQLEPESYEISEPAARAINRALDEGRRIISVGTTTTRALETVAAAHGGRMAAGAGATDLFIFPGFQFLLVQGLLTNFHLPRSSLLMLVSAFGGSAHVLAAYAAAIAERYRFYSYGDAMLVT